MDLDTIKNFFAQLFTELSHEDSWAIIFFLTVTFLLGLLFGWWAGRRGLRRLRKALKQKESELITLQAEYDTLKEKYEQKEVDLKAANEENTTLRAQVGALEREKASIQADLYTSKDQVEKLQTENLANLGQIDTLTEELNDWRNSGAQLGIADVDVDTGVSINAAELDEIKENYNTTADRLAALEAKLGRLENENSSLRTEVSSLKDTSVINLVDDEPDEEIDIVEEGPDEEIVIKPLVEDSALLAQQTLSKTLGTRIVAASIEDKDDLKKIDGIGPFIEEKLNKVGIYTFEQISQFDDEVIAQVTAAIEFFPGRIKRDDWVGQANELMDGR